MAQPSPQVATSHSWKAPHRGWQLRSESCPYPQPCSPSCAEQTRWRQRPSGNGSFRIGRKWTNTMLGGTPTRPGPNRYLGLLLSALLRPGTCSGAGSCILPRPGQGLVDIEWKQRCPKRKRDLPAGKLMFTTAQQTKTFAKPTISHSMAIGRDRRNDRRAWLFGQSSGLRNNRRADVCKPAILSLCESPYSGRRLRVREILLSADACRPKRWLFRPAGV